MSVADAWTRVRAAGRGTATLVRASGRAARRATNASGGGSSGLRGLIELHILNQGGDALVAMGLAGTLFFGVPVDDARGRVALYLLLTMAPFALVAPLVGPALDRMRSGRRYVIAGTMLARGLLCWAMASAVVSHDTVTLFPAAFGVLVLTKAYSVSRSAIVPRVLPSEFSLVKANARMSLAGTVGAGVLGLSGLGLTFLVGAGWTLRVTAVVFLAGTALGVRLPAYVDTPDDPDSGPQRRVRVRLGTAVREALVANMGLRAFSGFLILFFAFLVRVAGFGDLSRSLSLGLLVVMAGVGGLVGTGLGAWARSRAPEFFVVGALVLAMTTSVLAAWMYGLAAAAAVALVAGLGQALGKLGLDAVVQRDVNEEVRSSAFARSETALQLAWVVGGGAGLAVSLVPNGTVGLAICAAGLAGTLAALFFGRVRHRGRTEQATSGAFRASDRTGTVHASDEARAADS